VLKLVYADVNATHPCSPSHLQAVWSELQDSQGNPSSIHASGRKSRRLVEQARRSISQCLGAKATEIIFTSCATESNNWVLHVLAHQLPPSSEKRKLVISASEHSSVRKKALELAGLGLCELVTVGVSSQGLIDREALLRAVDETCFCVSIIHVQNEVGSCNDVERLAQEVKEKNPHLWFHVDAVQALGKCSLEGYGASVIDSASFSAHKIGGLQGVGCLYKKAPRPLPPFLIGGGQEGGVRSGTHNVSGILSFGLRAAFLLENPGWLKGAREATAQLQERISKIPGCRIHVLCGESVGTVTNFCVRGISRERMLVAFEKAGVCVSAGSACSSGSSTPSPVLLAMGRDSWEATHSLRVSFGAIHGLEDGEYVANVIQNLVDSVK